METKKIESCHMGSMFTGLYKLLDMPSMIHRLRSTLGTFIMGKNQVLPL